MDETTQATPGPITVNYEVMIRFGLIGRAPMLLDKRDMKNCIMKNLVAYLPDNDLGQLMTIAIALAETTFEAEDRP